MPNADPTASPTVILIHGLYMHGVCMDLLAARLRRAGFSTLCFSYPSLRRDAPANARALADFVGGLERPVLHFVAHSLGGLVLRHLLARVADLPPGRVVTLGTPHQGSCAARWLGKGPLRPILGQSLSALVAQAPPWPEDRALGSLAGTRNTGLGRLLAPVPPPADGTVRVEETYLAGMSDHISLPVSHTGMLLSRPVAAQTIRFLGTGRFRHPNT